jgi:hypothetical protein
MLFGCFQELDVMLKKMEVNVKNITAMETMVESHMDVVGGTMLASGQANFMTIMKVCQLFLYFYSMPNVYIKPMTLALLAFAHAVVQAKHAAKKLGGLTRARLMAKNKAEDAKPDLQDFEPKQEGAALSPPDMSVVRPIVACGVRPHF